MSIHEADGDLFAASWACLRETLAVGKVPRHFKEAVAGGTSEANRCPFCIDGHAMMFDVYSRSEAGRTLADDTFRSWNVEEIRHWARSCYSRERQRDSLPFPAEFRSEMVGTCICFHYLSRMVAIYLADAHVPKPGRWLAPLIHAVMGWNNKRPKRVGTSRLMNVPVTGGPDWADRDNVRVALSQLRAVTDDRITRILNESLVGLIETFLSRWRGITADPGTKWVRPHLEGISGFSELERRQARYMLLVIGSPYAVSDEEREALKRQMGKVDLLIMTAWVSTRAALRMGSLMVRVESE